MVGKNHDELVKALRAAARPLQGDEDLAPLLNKIKRARYVLLGEATHGTHEFYAWRAAITKRLIQQRQCSFIAVEGDWPDCYRVNRYVKAYADSGDSAEQVLRSFDRWPTWMWSNREIAELAEWLRLHNLQLEPEQRIGFYGLDVYSLWDSMTAVVNYLETVDPALARAARRAYMCFEPYGEDAQAYARATVMVPASCEDETVAVLRALRAKAPAYQQDDREAYYNAEQNALIARGAERYYRAMIQHGQNSWNVRDRHMTETLERLMDYHGPHARAVVWEHNTHVGDARFTNMARAGMVNVGQLIREAHPEPGVVRLVGFGTHSGTVIAAREWGAPMQAMRMPHARVNSLEDLLHRAGAPGLAVSTTTMHKQNSLLVFNGSDDGGIPGLDKSLDHRAIGVVYHPEAERRSNYVPTLVPRRYDAFLFIDHTRALDAFDVPLSPDTEPPETYPSGM
ncbi:erythromycin esterase family protein [Candidimonas sp. SYP-B2681]|uniref:erythromycin esterase family protein n=1 Tax=Candidimonas sp. SYP-B2681 TaxID=2497686 RepID=UPI000F88E955|nr:erythromycin esterase family protein [Candidimonas sp. SYP-B2681]RTZ43295.1 erythromycin esterase family protein [Candidimonas sp. SYP-B2681]